MKTHLYIVVWHHRHGTTAWPRIVPDNDTVLAEDEAEELGEQFEEDRDESIEVFGPFDPITGAEL